VVAYTSRRCRWWFWRRRWFSNRFPCWRSRKHSKLQVQVKEITVVQVVILLLIMEREVEVVLLSSWCKWFW
jgi:hypothetical protein